MFFPGPRADITVGGEDRYLLSSNPQDLEAGGACIFGEITTLGVKKKSSQVLVGQQ